MIPLSVPNIAGNEWRYVKECLDSGWISSAGHFVSEFEKSIQSYTGSSHAVACMNGTAALHVALKICNVVPGDCVLAPNLTFVATLNAISYCDATPILFDVDSGSWQLNLDLLQQFLETETEVIDGSCTRKSTGQRIAAIIPVHVLGSTCDMDRLVSLVRPRGIKIIEDACEALGTTFNGRHAGTLGDVGVLSFNGNKIISTGGGGMVLTNDASKASRAAHLTTQAKTSPTEYDHDQVGYNYRLVNILAAIGVAQIESIESFLTRNRERDVFYRTELVRYAELGFQNILSSVESNCWLFTLRTGRMRELLGHLEKNKIHARPFWRPMNQLPMFEACDYVHCNDASSLIYEQALSLPSSSNISDSQMESVVDAVHSFYKPECKRVRPTATDSNEKNIPHWKVQLFELNYNDDEARAAQQVINSRWITMGEQTKSFEKNFGELLQNQADCTAVSSCTAAMHTSLVASGVGPGDEVIIPALTFVAAANVVKLVGATPIPADSRSLDDWNICAETIQPLITSKTKAVMVVHYAGVPCDMDPILKLCESQNLILIEDVAHAPGALYKGQACGTFGDFGCFSFFTNKNLSIGEGGMIATKDPLYLETVQRFRSQGMTSQTLDRHKGHSSKYDVAISGLNYRMDEMRAAIGLVQLRKLSDGNNSRAALTHKYRSMLSSYSDIKVPFSTLKNVDPAYHIFPILVPFGDMRDQFMEDLRHAGVQTSIHYQSFRSFAAFIGFDFPPTPNADEISRRVVTLPLFPTMSEAQCELVVIESIKSLSTPR